MDVRLLLAMLALAGGALLADARSEDIAVPPGAASAADGMPQAAQEFLTIHNEARARVGVEPLRWSAQLARHAQQWADELATSGQFRHRDQTGTGYGENLFGDSDGFGPADAARHWLKERDNYRAGPITAQNFAAVGHYTQMVWRATTEVGYGVARGRNGVVIVANYAPGGNLVGQKPY
jgi:pathogenesis-related protein 1